MLFTFEMDCKSVQQILWRLAYFSYVIGSSLKLKNYNLIDDTAIVQLRWADTVQ